MRVLVRAARNSISIVALRSRAFASASSSTKKPIVTIPYSDLVSNKDLSAHIFEAYGHDGLGALTISGIPNYAELRKQLIPLSHKVAHLPESVKKTLEHEPSMYNVGWSHGKEKLGDTPDYAKGSFYANPLHDQAASEEVMAKYPFFYPKNIWPSKNVPELEQVFKSLGTVMHKAVVELTRHVDRVAQAHRPSYTPNLLYNTIKDTRKVKGRLLYYYPPASSTGTQAEDGWIGWHNDSGFLTALTADMYFDDTTGKLIPDPDPNAGLWIVDRKGGSVKVDIPKDHLAVQCGECLQIVTGGLLLATPHCVRPASHPSIKVGRGTFPVFIDTDMEFPLSVPKGVSRNAVFDKAPSSRVPPLEKRWLKDGVTFVDFLGDTFKQYYQWAKKN